MGRLRDRLVLTGAAVLLLGGGTGWAQDKAVSVHLNPSEVWVEPHVAGEAISLTVSCADGTYLANEYGIGERPSFQVGDAGGDGPCKYQVRICPPPDRAAQRAAEAVDDDAMLELLAQEEAEQMVTVSGSFEVLGGQIVSVAEEPAAEEEVSSAAHGHTH